VIVSFADSATARVWEREAVKKFGIELQRSAYRRLLILDAADYLMDLRRPPGNKLEALIGDRQGQHSIRINDQWRICFVWTPAGAEDVEIVDYH
jgi:proteic killer suppression protein